MYVFLNIYLNINLYIYLKIYLDNYLYISLYIHLYITQDINLYIYLKIYPYISLYIYLNIYLYIYLHVHGSICMTSQKSTMWRGGQLMLCTGWTWWRIKLLHHWVMLHILWLAGLGVSPAEEDRDVTAGSRTCSQEVGGAYNVLLWQVIHITHVHGHWSLCVWQQHHSCPLMWAVTGPGPSAGTWFLHSSLWGRGLHHSCPWSGGHHWRCYTNKQKHRSVFPNFKKPLK